MLAAPTETMSVAAQSGGVSDNANPPAEKSAASPYSSPYPTVIAVLPTQTRTPSATATITLILVTPTQAPLTVVDQIENPFPLSRILLIIGIALFVLGIMVFGIGYLRSRL